MDNLTLQKIKDILDKNSSIGISVGRNPGVDAMGAALALYLSLKNVGKSVSIICPTEPIVEVSSLIGIDQVKSTLVSQKSGDLTVSFPYREGEIEKISYTLEDGFLNILVKAGKLGLSFDERDIMYKRGGGAQGLIFTIGAARLSDLDKLLDVAALKDTKIINIDNKPENQGYGDIVLVSTRFSSVSEQVASLMFSLGFKIDIDIAQNLLSGISNATDNFQSLNASPLAFEMAASLMKKGAARTTNNVKKPEAETDDRYSFFSPLTRKLGRENKTDENNPPDDWLAPKIYKGSTNI